MYHTEDRYTQIIGQSQSVIEVRERIKMAAKTSANVIIYGETGTGKELVARTIHNQGERRNGPFYPVQCNCYPEGLIENELFGHEAGAYTDARLPKKGLFELACGGTLFLDEVSEISLPIQAKLLRVIENFAFTRVGGTEEINIDVRLIAATNGNLKRLMKKGLFRKDLFYRLHVLPIELLPLRQRREDIPLLVQYYLSFYARQYQQPIPQISFEAMECLLNYNWPGNVRELQNVLQQAIICAQGKNITQNELPKEVVQNGVKPKLTLSMQREKEQILSALEETGGKIILAAQKLRISRFALYRRLKKYDIRPKEQST